MNKLKLGNAEFRSLVGDMVQIIRENIPDKCALYPIPRGGIPVAYMMQAIDPWFEIVATPEEADFFVDDIIASGATERRYYEKYKKPLFALIDQTSPGKYQHSWIIFPWEDSVEAGVEENIKRLLQAFDPNPERSGLKETPQRVAKAWKFWTSGYDQDPSSVFKVFNDGAESYDEMVVVRNIPFYSNCEHHMAPFFGTVSIGYLPTDRIIGLSKLARLTDIFSRRLQVQERLTRQICESIQDHLEPYGAGVYIKSRHLCMESRGICKQGQDAITMALTGSFLEQPSVKAEFLSHVRE